jgi:uncharacterized protein (DUF779 family)
MYTGAESFSAEGILGNKSIVLLYFSMLLVLVVLIVWYLKQGSSEHYFGYGMPKSIQFAAGAPDIRFQEFTGTNQGSTPMNIPTVKQMYPGLISRKERLTAMREPPVFWDISQTLGEYQYASQFGCADGSPPMPVKDSFGNMTYACADGSTPVSNQTGLDAATTEHATASPATAVQEALLMRQLGY